MSMMFVLGCDQGDERFAEKARIEGRESAKAELQAQIEDLEKRVQLAKVEGKALAEAELAAQNSNLDTRSQEMETDLAIRHRFYQAVQGTYEGSLQTEMGAYKVKVTLVPSLPPYVVKRTRQLEEVASDLNNLYFNAHLVQWNPKDSKSATGCRVEQIRPDIVNGEIVIASENCANLYSLRISAAEGDTSSIPTANLNVSAALAASVRAGTIGKVSQISGEVHPTTNASIYQLSVTRKVK